MDASTQPDVALAVAVNPYPGRLSRFIETSREAASAIDEQASQNQKNERVRYQLFFETSEE
jgi:hypothetical protein